MYSNTDVVCQNSARYKAKSILTSPLKSMRFNKHLNCQMGYMDNLSFHHAMATFKLLDYEIKDSNFFSLGFLARPFC